MFCFDFVSIGTSISKRSEFCKHSGVLSPMTSLLVVGFGFPAATVGTRGVMTMVLNQKIPPPYTETLRSWLKVHLKIIIHNRIEYRRSGNVRR